MKEPREWDEEYLLNLAPGEFDWLEVKGRGALDISLAQINESVVRETLSKAISAFANSGGGTLVLGMKFVDGKALIDDGGINLTMKKPTTREWLEDVIPNVVDPPLTSFNVYVIEPKTPESTLLPGRGIFIIHVSDSLQAPHQANDNRYYARVGGKSRPIGHRLVADIFGRRQNPQIDMEFTIETREVDISGPTERGRFRVVTELVMIARNNGRVFANYVNCYVYVPAFLIPENEKTDDDIFEIEGVDYYQVYNENTIRDPTKSGLFGPTEYGPSRYDPILPGRAYSWTQELIRNFSTQRLSISDQAKIIWEVYSDNAPKREGSILVNDVKLIGF